MGKSVISILMLIICGTALSSAFSVDDLERILSKEKISSADLSLLHANYKAYENSALEVLKPTLANLLNEDGETLEHRIFALLVALDTVYFGPLQTLMGTTLLSAASAIGHGYESLFIDKEAKSASNTSDLFSAASKARQIVYAGLAQAVVAGNKLSATRNLTNAFENAIRRIDRASFEDIHKILPSSKWDAAFKEKGAMALSFISLVANKWLLSKDAQNLLKDTYTMALKTFKPEHQPEFSSYPMFVRLGVNKKEDVEKTIALLNQETDNAYINLLREVVRNRSR